MNRLSKYFDLNSRLHPLAAAQSASTGARSAAAASLPLRAGAARRARAEEASAEVAPAPGAEKQLSAAWQVLTYVVLLFSIVASRFLDLYRMGVASEFSVDWRYLLFLAIVSLLAFPAVYDRVIHSINQPLLVRIGAIFALGMGWEKIVATAAGK